MFFRSLTLLSLCLASQWVGADSPDHPLLDPYPGAEIEKRLYAAYEQVDVPSGPMDTDGNIPSDALVGDFTRITYEIEGVSTLKVFENYKAALENAGATLVSVCELEQCGDERSAADELAEHVGGIYNVGNYYRKPYFLRAQLEADRGKVHIALFVGGYRSEVRVQQVVIEETPLENGLVTVDKAYLAKEVEASPTTDQRTPEEKQQDHPMIARYPGAELKRERSAEYESISIPLSVTAPDGTASDVMELIGDVQQHTYLARGVSTLKVYQNYRQAIEELGFSVVFSCDLNACGNEEASQELGDLVAILNVNNFYRKPYYVVATRDTAHGQAHIVVYIGGYDGDVRIQQTIVEEKGTETDLVKVDADELYQEIQQSGKALVYGIYFDTDSAKVKPESSEALQAISGLLESQPDLDLYVVGHTDDTGEVNHNRTLSARRAASVVEALRTDYSVDKSRMEPAGVGPYAPVVGNESEEGRRLNRRVELVRRL